MNPNLIDRMLYVDESGTAVWDPLQSPWLVLAGVEIPTNQIDSVEQFYRKVCHNFLPAHVADDVNLDLKGWQLFKPKPKWLTELPFEKRIEFGRQLLSIPYSVPGVQFYVSAIDTREFPDSAMLGTWPQFVEELLARTCKTYLFALSEMVGDFAFHLDRDLSSGIDESILPPREARRIENGQLLIDENSILKPRLQELERVLRQERDYSEDGTSLFKWRVLEGNVLQPWSSCDSKKHKLLQFADILAAIVRLKHTESSLPAELDRVYFQARLFFQTTRSHFYPRENVNINDMMRWAGIGFAHLGDSVACQ